MSKQRTVAPGTHTSVAWLGTATFSLVAFVLLTLAVFGSLIFPFDAPILAMARTLDGAPLVWNAFSQSANFPLIAIAIIFMAWLVRVKRYREAVLVLVMLIAITAGSEGIKQLVGRARPAGNGDGIPGVVYSYPSGHVLEVMTILGSLVIRAWRSSAAFRLQLIFFLLVALEVVFVAIARMALNEHFPTDILGGALGSLSALGFYGWFTRAGGWADRPTRNRRIGS